MTMTIIKTKHPFRAILFIYIIAIEERRSDLALLYIEFLNIHRKFILLTKNL